MTQLQYYNYSINCNFNFDHFLNISRIVYIIARFHKLSFIRVVMLSVICLAVLNEFYLYTYIDYYLYTYIYINN